MAENGKSQTGQGPEKQKIQAPEITLPYLKPIAESKEALLQQEGRERSEIAIDLREKQSKAKLEEKAKRDPETALEIETIDPNKESNEQLSAMKRLELVSYTVLAKLFEKGITMEDIADFEKIKNVKKEAWETLNESQKAALKKLQEIATKNGGTLYAEMKDKWPGFLKSAQDIYKKSANIRDGVTEKAGGYASKFFSWIKENPGKTLLITAAAYGAYKLLFDDDEKKDGEKSFWDTIGLGSWKGKIIGAGAMGLTAVVLGSILDSDSVKNWLKTNTPLGQVASIAEKGKEMVEHGMKWLDDKVHFGKIKDKIVDFGKEYGITMPEWANDLSLSTVAKDLGISEGNEKSWKEYAELAATGAGLAGSALLIYKWWSKKGLLGTAGRGLAMNAGMYLFIVREGKDSFGGKILGGLSGEFDKAKSKVLGDLQKNRLWDYVIPDAFEDMKLENGIDKMLDWIKEHPAEGMLAINGLWLCRAYIVPTLKKTVLTAIKYPGKSLFVSGLVGLSYLGRRQLMKDLVDRLYDDPKSAEAKSMLESLYALPIIGIDAKSPETLAEKQGAAFVKSIVEDPLKALNLSETVEAYDKGDFAIVWDISGKASLLVKGLSAPIQLGKLSWESFTTSLAHIYSPDRKGSAIVPAVVGQAEAYIFGSMAWEGFKAYGIIGDVSKSKPDFLWKMLKSTIPGTEEWRYIAKSCATGIPGIKQTIEAAHLGRVKDAEKSLTKIAELAKQGASKEAEITTELVKINKLLEEAKNTKKLAGAGVEATAHIRDADKVLQKVESIKKAMDVGKYSEVVTAAEKGIKVSGEIQKASTLIRALEEGGTVARLLTKAEPLLKVARPVLHVGGKVLPVIDAVVAWYDVYDQSDKLYTTIKSEGVKSVSEVPGALKSMAKRSEETEKSLSNMDNRDADEVIKETDSKKKLLQARNVALNLHVRLRDYGFTRKEAKKEQGWIDTIEDVGGKVLSDPLSGWNTSHAYGSHESHFKTAEQEGLKNHLDQAKRVKENIINIQPKTAEVAYTIKALEQIIALGEKTLQKDEVPTKAELDGTYEELKKAKAEAQIKNPSDATTPLDLAA